MIYTTQSGGTWHNAVFSFNSILKAPFCKLTGKRLRMNYRNILPSHIFIRRYVAITYEEIVKVY